MASKELNPFQRSRVRFCIISGEHAPLARFFITSPPSLWVCARLRHCIPEQCRFSPAGRDHSLGRRIRLGESRRLAVGTHVGRNIRLLLGRHLCLFARSAVGPWQLRENSLASSDAETARVAPAIFQTSWRKDCFHRAVHRPVSASCRQSFGGHDENAVAALSVVQSHGVGSL